MGLRDAATTPIIPGFFPDPSVCRAGDTLYLANSSFEYSPGVPLWRSDDLVTWREAGHALDGDPAFTAGDAAAGGGVYAPTLRHHDGRFWMITTNVSGAPGQLVTSAPEIEGPWEPARVITGIPGIDPDLAWDDDGTCLISYSSNTAEVPGIGQVPVDLEQGVVIGPPRSIMPGTGLAYPEGPHVFRRGAWWYLLFAEGGTERGHCVSVARGPAASGPFELCPANPILTRRSTTFPVQNTGHSDVVELADGSWAMVYLGVRPRGATPLFHVNGRETFLAGVDWVDDWPVVVTDRYEIPAAPTAFVDRFETLHPRWISPGAAPADIATVGDGVTLRAVETPGGAPALLGVRARDPYWRFAAVTEARDGAALRVRMDERHWYELRLTGGRPVVHARIGSVSQEFAADMPLVAHGAIELLVRADAATTGGPDDLVFEVADADGIHLLVRLDGRYLSTEVAGGFVGRVIGLRTEGGPVRFTEARYAPEVPS